MMGMDTMDDIDDEFDDEIDEDFEDEDMDDEAFMYNFTDGQSYTVNCSGMTATTTVRTQK